MRLVTAVAVLLSLLGLTGAQAEKAGEKAVALKKPVPAPKNGIKTPGVQIPFSGLKPELEYPVATAPTWLAFTDTLWLPDSAKQNLARIDLHAKEPKFGDPLPIKKPCTGMVNAFQSLWIPDCDDGTLARVDARSGKVTATISTGVGTARSGIVASGDSVWLITDTRATLTRIDPQENTVVAEIRIPSNCNTLSYAETSLWLTCPADDRVLRFDPQTNLMTKAIDVTGGPEALVSGDNSIWVLTAKEGKIQRLDPKTDKIVKTIELLAPAPGGSMAFGEGSLWVSAPGFPVTRIDTTADKEKVMQQFYGEGAGLLFTTQGALWLADSRGGSLLKIDPKRVVATLAE